MKLNQEHINSTISDTFKEVKNIIDTQTVIGKEITTSDGTIIVPVSKVIVGYIGGGGEYFDVKVKKNDSPYASGCGTGAYINPIGFLVTNKDGVTNFIEVKSCINIDKIASYIEKFLNSLNKGDE